MRKTVSGVMLTLLLIGMLALSFNVQPVKTEPTTIIVPDDYTFIQSAINAANQGDTIYVRAGTYYENLVVDKSLSLIGENRSMTIVDGNNRGHVIHVKADNTVISNFTIQKSTYGIYLDGSAGCTIQNNNIADNTAGVLLWSSSSNTLMNNNVTNNVVGIHLYMSSNNSIHGNSVAKNEQDGIWLEYSSNNILRDNNMANNKYNFEVSGWELSHFMNDVDVSNTINDKPIYYWISKRDMAVPTDAGYVAIINSTNITIEGLDLKNNRLGVLLVYTRNSLISNNKISNDWGDGVRLLYSSNNTLMNNNITNNNFAVTFAHSFNNTLSYNRITASYNQGVMLYNSSGNMLIGNNISNNLYGTSLGDSSNNTISGNNITNNDYGIALYSSSNYNSISGNNIANSDDYGIYLSYSSSNSIYGNFFINDGLFVDWGSYGNLVWNNTVNDKPLIYLEDVSNVTVGDAGQVLLVNCNRIVVESLNLSDTTVGVQLWNTTNSIIADNNITNNRYGISLYMSSGNAIYHNNFIDNTYQVSSVDSVNVWDHGYPSGGNYWSDYAGVDDKRGPNQDLPGSDGIGDAPYRIDKKNRDYYPLMSPWLAVPPEHEHELVVSIRAPASLRLGDSTTLASIVINQGLKDEANVELMLVINGTIINSTTIPVLRAGTSYILSYFWTPTDEGTYNVTAYARPVPGETFTENNQITRFTEVTLGILRVPEGFATIEKAIDAAYPGDKILVRAGIYRENIVIDKPGLSLVGEDPANTVIDAYRETGIKVTASNVTVTNFTIQNSGWGWGIELVKADGCTIIRNIVTNNNEGGIRLAGSSNNIISENNITDNGRWLYWDYGIELTFLSIWEGYWPEIYSNNNTIIGNIITKNTGGIVLKSSNYNNVSGNIVTDNDEGIIIRTSRGNLLRDNNLTANSHNLGVYTYDVSFSDFVHDIDASNTVNGKPVQYLVNQRDSVINSSDIGYLALINCTNIYVKGLTLKNNSQGLLLAFTTNSTIENVTTTNNEVGIQVLQSDGNTIIASTATNNGYGISLYHASFNNITKNTVTNNGGGVSIGIHVTAPGWLLIGHVPCENNTIGGNIISNNTGNSWKGGIVLAGGGTKYNNILRNTILGNYQGVLILWSASDNRICHNNFIDNKKQVYFDEGVAENIWDDGYPFGGNCWSDYVGVDVKSGPNQDLPGSDGIGDTPYIIDADNRDRYPLMKPWTLLGDINSDEVVDIRDLAVFGRAFGSTPGHERWNPKADINGDGKVNILDGVFIAKNFGKKL